MKNALKMVSRIMGMPVDSHKIFGRPIARFFGFLSIVWLFLSFTPVSLLFAFGTLWIKTEPSLSYICWFLIIPHPIIVALAIYFWLTEKPRNYEEDYVKEDDNLIKNDFMRHN